LTERPPVGSNDIRGRRVVVKDFRHEQVKLSRHWLRVSRTNQFGIRTDGKWRIANSVDTRGNLKLRNPPSVHCCLIDTVELHRDVGDFVLCLVCIEPGHARAARNDHGWWTWRIRESRDASEAQVFSSQGDFVPAVLPVASILPTDADPQALSFREIYIQYAVRNKT